MAMWPRGNVQRKNRLAHEGYSPEVTEAIKPQDGKKLNWIVSLKLERLYKADPGDTVTHRKTTS